MSGLFTVGTLVPFTHAECSAPDTLLLARTISLYAPLPTVEAPTTLLQGFGGFFFCAVHQGAELEPEFAVLIPGSLEIIANLGLLCCVSTCSSAGRFCLTLDFVDCPIPEVTFSGELQECIPLKITETT